jgi:hypothetical protein
MMDSEGCGRKQSWSNLRYCLGICLEELRKAMKKLMIAYLWAEI